MEPRGAHMPAAVAPCTGALRLVAVAAFNDRDEVDCPHCSLKLRAERYETPLQKWYATPHHRASGVRHAEPGESRTTTAG